MLELSVIGIGCNWLSVAFLTLNYSMSVWGCDKWKDSHEHRSERKIKYVGQEVSKDKPGSCAFGPQSRSFICLFCIVLFALPQQGFYTSSPSCLIINEFMTTVLWQMNITQCPLALHHNGPLGSVLHNLKLLFQFPCSFFCQPFLLSNVHSVPINKQINAVTKVPLL